MRNLSRKDHSPERYFGTYVDSQKSARLYVGEKDAITGDRFALIRAGDYTFANFAKDFNSHPLKETQNVRLNVGGANLEMQVDGKKFKPSECKLTTYHLQVGLSVRFQEGREVRLWLDGNGIRPVYNSRYKISLFQASDASLRILYESKNEISSKYLISSHAMQNAEPHKLRNATIRSVDEKNVYKVAGFRDQNVERRALFIPKKELNAKGIDGQEVSKSSANVIEVKLRNVSQPKESFDTCYGRITPSKGHVGLPMGKKGWEEGERFELVEMRKYGLNDFVDSFNSKSKDRLNATLSLDKKNLSLDVAGKRYDFEYHRILAYDSEVVLKARSRDVKDEFRFWFDGNDIRATYGNQYRILSFENSDWGLLTKHNYDGQLTTTIHADFGVNPEQALTMLDKNQIAERLKLIDKPSTLEGEYSFEADVYLRGYVLSRLRRTHWNRYKSERGSLGEEICPAILTLGGWEERRRHPEARAGESVSTQHRGPDSLMVHKESEIQYPFEYKWTRDYQAGIKDGYRQLTEGYGQGWKSHNGTGFEYAFIASLDWHPTSPRGKLIVTRVKL